MNTQGSPRAWLVRLVNAAMFLAFLLAVWGVYHSFQIIETPVGG